MGLKPGATPEQGMEYDRPEWGAGSDDYDPMDSHDDNGGAEGPSFEQSMRNKYPLFHDRRDTHTGMSGR